MKSFPQHICIIRFKKFQLQTSRILNDEKETDNKIRNQFGVKWTRVPSEQLTVPLIQELGKYRGILNTAANADGIVRKKFGENARGIELLSMNEVSSIIAD